jgi:hypothetical protein
VVTEGRVPHDSLAERAQRQAGEREADREIAAGDLSPVYGSAEDAVA